MQCTMLADKQDKWTRACPGVNAPSAPSLIPRPGPSSLQPQQLGCRFSASYQDLSIFEESQKDDPGDPGLQARDSVTMKPSLTCLEPPTICMLPPPE